jgi:hypothetical protein
LPPVEVTLCQAGLLVAAMQALSFLRKGSQGHALRTLWKEDKPLKMSEGGAIAAMSSVDIIALKVFP